MRIVMVAIASYVRDVVARTDVTLITFLCRRVRIFKRRKHLLVGEKSVAVLANRGDGILGDECENGGGTNNDYGERRTGTTDIH